MPKPDIRTLNPKQKKKEMKKRIKHLHTKYGKKK